MKFEVVNSDQLLHLAGEALLVEKLLLQVEKDFKLANAPLNLTIGFDPQSFVSKIHEKVYFLMIENFSGYLNLLYVIDVPEGELQHLEITDSVEVAQHVTFLILKREYQKVWFKNNYS